MAEKTVLQEVLDLYAAGVNEAIDAIDGDFKRVQAQRDELLAALKALMNDIDSGVLVRNTDRDLEPDWHIRMLAFVGRLHAAQAAIAKAEGK